MELKFGKKDRSEQYQIDDKKTSLNDNSAKYLSDMAKNLLTKYHFFPTKVTNYL